MKGNVLIMALALVISLGTGSYAQKKEKKEKKAKVSKEEKAAAREWKKQTKNLDPMEYKKLVEESNALKSEASSLNAKLVGLEEQIGLKDAEIEKLRAEVKQMEGKYADEQASNVTGMGRAMNVKGVVFKVQIGAFRKKDLTKYLENNPNFSGDVDADGTKKYTLGYFGDYWEADTFKKYLREMGVKDAWIVAYKNGERVDIKDVLEGAI